VCIEFCGRRACGRRMSGIARLICAISSALAQKFCASVRPTAIVRAFFNVHSVFARPTPPRAGRFMRQEARCRRNARPLVRICIDSHSGEWSAHQRRGGKRTHEKCRIVNRGRWRGRVPARIAAVVAACLRARPLAARSVVVAMSCPPTSAGRSETAAVA